ncbi:HET-domain-containing protein [Colletotrichum eremochloae]|nr:HET-domain-containing protein [Colletotrichum eremochloae]
MNPPEDPFELSGSTLCQLCRTFIKELSVFWAEKRHLGKGWTADKRRSLFTITFPYNSSRVAFKHQLSFDSLASSALSCELCHVLHDQLAKIGPDLRIGWLGLLPCYWHRKGYFRARFSMSKSLSWERVDPSFRIGRLRNFVYCDQNRRNPITYEDIIVTPRHLTPAYIAQKYRDWIAMCQTDESHKSCRRGTYLAEGGSIEDRHPHATSLAQGALPTRVIDLGPPQSAELPRLYVAAPGEQANYVALSHCWGGTIPSSTFLANLGARLVELPVKGLPRNFQDAIAVTRALGIRYLWIDSLCIIQDSQSDWFAEARNMASVYAGATVTLSALDAASSNAGFLHPEGRAPTAILNEDYAIQKEFSNIYDYLQGCPLNSRAWCMQERLLSPRVMHFSREQMLWECNRFLTTESNDYFEGHSNHVAGLLLYLRGLIREQPRRTRWGLWYQLVEEYTTRKLTFGADKLPALAGLAALFKSLLHSDSLPTYVAGLWREDIANGLIWGAKYNHVNGQRRHFGYIPSDVCSTLVEAPPVNNQPRAPSWSWASVDGEVMFWSVRSPSDNVLDKVSIVMQRGEDSFIEPQPIGALNVRGLFAEVVYHPPIDSYRYTGVQQDIGVDVGSLEVVGNEEFGYIHGCVMDTKRDITQRCYALIVCITPNGVEKYMLVLEKRDVDMTFKRVGICRSLSDRDFVKEGGFKSKDITLT